MEGGIKKPAVRAAQRRQCGDCSGRFPDIKSKVTFESPGYYKIRVGNYRTRMEGTKDLVMIRKFYPDAYLVPDKINFPDLN